MKGKQIEDLYFDESFDDFVISVANKNLIDYEELKQSVFLEICEKELSIESCKKVVYKLAKRMQRDEINNKSYELLDFDQEDLEDNERSGEIIDVKNWYWRGCSPEMNKGVV